MVIEYLAVAAFRLCAHGVAMPAKKFL